MTKMQMAGKKAAITRKLNKQIKGCKSPRTVAAYRAHATRKMNALSA